MQRNVSAKYQLREDKMEVMKIADFSSYYCAPAHDGYPLWRKP